MKKARTWIVQHQAAIGLLLCLAFVSWVAADLGVRDNADYVSYPIRLPLDSAGIPVTPDSFHVVAYCDTCLEPAYVARATSAFTDIGIDTVTLWGKLHWWYHMPVNTIDSTKGNVGYGVEITGWTKKLPTQTMFSFQEADTGFAANVANVKLATTYSKKAADSLDAQDDWVAGQGTLEDLIDSLYGVHVDLLDSVHAAIVAALQAYAEAKRAAESLDVAATAGDVATTVADTMIARGYAGGADSTNSPTLFTRIYSAYLTALAARDSAHAAVLKGILAADSAHAAVLAAFVARDSAHAAVVAALVARDSAHAAVLQAIKAADSGHAAVLAANAARVEARDSAHAANLTAYKARDSAHAANLTAYVARDSAHAANLSALTTPGDSTKSPTLFDRIFGSWSMAKDARDTGHAAVQAALSTPGDSTKSPTLFQRIYGAYSMAKDGRDSASEAHKGTIIARDTAHAAVVAALAARDTVHAGNVTINLTKAYLDSLAYWTGYRVTVRSETNYDADEDTVIFYKGVDTLGFEVYYHPSGTAGQAPDSTKFWPVDSLR